MIKRSLKFFVTIFSFLTFFLYLSPIVQAASSQFIIQGNTNEKIIALTFDDGSDGTNFGSILDILSQHGIKATFFLTGSGASAHPQHVKKAVFAGHDIGNHSYDHPDFTTISKTEILSQLSQTETIIKSLTGQTTKPYFRAPYGATNASVLKIVGDAGYTYTFHWTIDSLDWTGNSATTIQNRVMNNLQPGTILLMHTGYGATGTLQALKTLIPQLKNKGYKFVTVSQLLGIQSPPGVGNTYTVKAGDTLYAIALRYGVTVTQLANANKITNPNLIRVGQTLTIPGGTSTPTPPATPSLPSTTYTVKAGDTLYAIAVRYGVTVTQLANANKITNPNLIRVGQIIKIPGTSSAPITRTYTVKSGDTLYAIANKLGTSVENLVRKNNIANPNLIRVGQVLQY
ncbi:Peptidoglycan-N-acetylmuramic acid deacetylase PdaA [Jeotgalibaca dankookensis]|uniref:Peptidoglycan-N-acetylmuramic acid deacetylase PdaA n=1 Tax=Jeotgalibaca dankookensis TaxID=708126 RepID=A0A1S6IP67_9LACT|nr:LysM peptidoglycan-binding domain-containing protein [Jeotgalibaca dankookensis]AQS53347.1 Peptidoglycan-N-acetylmuramic acid deacetylase PdaA [Jeotgalibaca dankookensis]